ncbi:MAG: HAMP domain-containing sensor histidine kinase [Verrucomicrobiota bacterium]
MKPADHSFRPGIFSRTVGLYRDRVHALANWMDGRIPPELCSPPETFRRARLVTRFGFLGAFFGIIYATFYFLIDHPWGAAVILFCSSGFAATPFIMRRKTAIEPAAHFLSLILILGFTALCFIEGGLRGHAIAWLVSVPLCSLLLVGQKPAARWAVATFASASLVIAFDLAGKRLPVLYDSKWETIVSAAGYLGLILFMFILGLIFESGRARAFEKVQSVLTELAVSNERLVYLNSEKDEFLGIAAHDLKNPLTVIAGSAELVMMSRDQAMIDKLSRNIIGAATRMRDLIGNLLDVNAIEQGKFTSNIEPCDLSALARQSVENNQASATRKQIQLHLGFSPGVQALADRNAALQILDNLISNALKYSPSQTTVQVIVENRSGKAVVSVKDEGPGISEADQKKLFGKFTRLTARPTGGESSTGLGLAIVKRLAEAMSGSVHCNSVLGQGATFVLMLPEGPGAGQGTRRETSSTAPRATSACAES